MRDRYTVGRYAFYTLAWLTVLAALFIAAASNPDVLGSKGREPIPAWENSNLPLYVSIVAAFIAIAFMNPITVAYFEFGDEWERELG